MEKKKAISEYLNLKKLEEILKKSRDKKILVIGDVMLDCYIWGDVSRISPEAPVPVVEVKLENFVPGGAGNVALNVKSLGGNVILVGAAGRDKNSEILENAFKEKGIETYLLKRDTPTITKTRIIGKNQQIVRIDREEKKTLSNQEIKEVKKIIKTIKDKIDGIIVSDYGKGMITTALIKFLVEIKKERNIVLTVDPKIQHFSFYKEIDCLTPNKREAAEGIKETMPENFQQIIKIGNKIKKKLKCKILLITLGKDGMILFNREDNIFHIPSVAKEVYDVTGAGDTVISAFTLAFVETGDEIISSAIANFAAGVVVGKLGTATVSVEELKKFFGRNVNSEYIRILK